jgi:hypothetical protein
MSARAEAHQQAREGLLPHPDSPTMANVSPRRTLRETVYSLHLRRLPNQLSNLKC